MSRALESEVAASIKSGDPLTAYHAISELLDPRPAGDLLELEILGRSHPFPEGCYVLQDGCAAAVSKLGLVQAFLVAKKILASHFNGSAPQKDDKLLAATAVMLLMDPEHLTAANTRKRVLKKKVSSEPCSATSVSLNAEKHFLDSMFTSRLHRHTKSPTLWAHLQWLLCEFISFGIPINGFSDLAKVIFVAGERHPRNYYAWNHARFLIKGGLLPPTDEVLARVMKWCSQHHTDTSGWSFMYFLLRNMGPASLPSACLVFGQTLALAESLRLTNEALWIFLRTLAASPLSGEQEQSRFLSAATNFLKDSKLPTDRGVLKSALEWCETYRTKAPLTEVGGARDKP